MASTHRVLVANRLLELARNILANAGEQLRVKETELSPALVRDALAHVELERFKPNESRGSAIVSTADAACMR